jgi:hypothetical protein
MIGRIPSDASPSIALRERRSKLQVPARAEAGLAAMQFCATRSKSLERNMSMSAADLEFGKFAGEGRAKIARIRLPGMKLAVVETEVGAGIKEG